MTKYDNIPLKFIKLSDFSVILPLQTIFPLNFWKYVLLRFVYIFEAKMDGYLLIYVAVAFYLVNVCFIDRNIIILWDY